MGKVRTSDRDPKNADMRAILKIQNKLVRFLNSAWLKDKISTANLLGTSKMLSIKQINAQIKLSEMCKATK